MAAHSGDHFVLLLSDGGFRFRALYSFDIAQTNVEKLVGVGLSRLRPAMVKQYLKYSTGSRSFVPIVTKGFTVQSDAVILKRRHVLLAGQAGNVRVADVATSNNNNNT